jgi:hypothetical protein
MGSEDIGKGLGHAGAPVARQIGLGARRRRPAAVGQFSDLRKGVADASGRIFCYWANEYWCNSN